MNLMNILTAYANEERIAVHVRRRIGLHVISGKKWEPLMLHIPITVMKPNK